MSEKMKIVMCGEAWGRHEDELKHPLVGPSGRELTIEMGKAGLSPYLKIKCRKCGNDADYKGTPHCDNCNEHIWPNGWHLLDHWKRLRNENKIAVTNVFNIRPPNNDLGNFFGKTIETPMPGWKASKNAGGSHVKKEYFPHIEKLWQEIEDLDPNLIICMGNASCWAILEQTKITTLRGTVTWSTKLNKKALPTFHPAAVLRNMPLRVSVLADYNKAAREAEYPEIRRKPRNITVIDPTENGIKEGYNWFRKPALAYANDIETLKNQISIVGFARSNDDALVIPFRSHIDYSNYWPTEALEVQAWRLVEYGLQTLTPKIYQNGLFDISHLAKMGLFPKNVLHDTMLWHHSEYPELPKSLGYLASIYSDEIAWKTLRTRGTLKRDE